jgi:hypothetical protein
MRPALTALLGPWGRPRKCAVVAGIVAGSLVLAGCASARPASPPIAARLSEAALAAVAQDGSFAADEVLLHRADEKFIGQCMAAHGQRYVSQPYGPATMSSLTDDEAHPDMTWRRSAGYSLRGAFAGPVRGENDRLLATLSATRQAAWQRTLKGDGTKMWSMRTPSGHTFTSPTDGCVAESQRRTYGTPEDASRVLYYLQDVRLSVGEGVQADARYAAAVGRWAACMRGQGYTYATPSAAREAISARYQRHAADPAALQRAEIGVAVADGECAAASGLTSVASRLARSRAEALPAGVRRQLNAAASARIRGIAEARKALAAPPGAG